MLLFCKRCQINKDQTQFYKHAAMANGFLSFCKDCTKKRIKDRRAAVPDEYKARDKIRNTKPHRVARRAKHHATPEGKASLDKSKKQWIDNNPEKRAAHRKVRRAVVSGKLVKQPCYKCGEGRVQAHHSDYAKPLEVIWCCSKHHAEFHYYGPH